jgi:HK97 family phage major capsid protein
MACKAWEGLLTKYGGQGIGIPSGSFEESDPDGGLLIPPQWSQELYERTYKQNQLLKYLNPIPVTGRIMRFPALKEDSRATGLRHGGTTGYWEGEADQHTQVWPRLRTVSTELHKLTVFVPVTNEMIEDVPQALDTYLKPLAAAEINFKINDAVINGTGNGMPMGILKANSRITVPALSGQGAGTIVAVNVLKMKNRIVPAFREDSVWMFSADAEMQITSMYVASGQYAATNLIGYNDDGELRILGRPALLIEQCQSLGTEGDIICFAPDGYRAIVKGGIESFMSIHLYFDYDQSVFKFRFRFDGQPADDVSLTPYMGSQQTSSIVTLNSTRT